MTESREARVGGLLLAAGGSTRFGSPKQLAQFKGKTLIRRAAEAISMSGCSPVVIVLGSCVEECSAEIRDLDVSIVVNNDWQTGMSSSIKAGLAKLLEIEPNIDGVLISLMDQPMITSTHLSIFVEKFNDSPVTIIAAEYSGIAGVPALFSGEMFDELLQLEGDQGARSLVRARSAVIMIKLPEASKDIDFASDV